MPRYQSAVLREERAQLTQRLQNIVHAAAQENRDLNTEERAETRRLEARFAEASHELKMHELREGYAPGAGPERNGGERRGRTLADDLEYRDAIVRALQNGDPHELRTAFATQVSANGGFAVPQSWADGVRDILVDIGAIRRLATVQQTVGGNIFHVPVVGTPGTATLRAEAGALNESEDTLGEVQMAAWEVSQLIKTSREFLRDGVNVDQYIQRRAGQGIGIKEGALFAVGTGSSQPKGLVPAATVGKTAASTTAIAYADMVDLLYSVSSPYRNLPSAAFIVADTTAASLMKLVDSQNRPLWIPNTAVGQPDTFLGKPIYTDPNVPAIATGNRSVVFGAISEYMVRVAGTLEIQILQELYAGNGQVGFWVREYVDGNLLTLSAVKALIHP